MEKTSGRILLCILAALAHATLEVRPGVNVTLSCSNLAKEQTQVDWFRVTNGTNASCVSSVIGLEDEPSYCQGFKSGKFVMSSNETDLFLSIEAVDSSDAGLYFCGFFMTSNIVLGETTYLKVTGHNEVHMAAPGEETTQLPTCHPVSLTLGAVVVLSCVVISALSVRLLHLQRGAAERIALETKESRRGQVYMATAARRRRLQAPEETIVVYTSVQ